MITEMVDGAVFVRPAAGFAQVDAVLALAGTLRAGAPAGLRVLTAPFPVRLGRRTLLRPDLLVARYADLVRDELTEAPLLAVEVDGEASDLRRVLYARHRVGSYWLLDPRTPALTVLELDSDGDYRTVAEVVGAERFAATRPFPVVVRPLDLVAGLRPA